MCVRKWIHPLPSLTLTPPLSPCDSEKTRLQDDIRQKQELIQDRKGEIEVRDLIRLSTSRRPHPFHPILPPDLLPSLYMYPQNLQADAQKYSLQKEQLQREKEVAQRELEQLEGEVGTHMYMHVMDMYTHVMDMYTHMKNLVFSPESQL